MTGLVLTKILYAALLQQWVEILQQDWRDEAEFGQHWRQQLRESISGSYREQVHLALRELIADQNSGYTQIEIGDDNPIRNQPHPVSGLDPNWVRDWRRVQARKADSQPVGTKFRPKGGKPKSRTWSRKKKRPHYLDPVTGRWYINHNPDPNGAPFNYKSQPLPLPPPISSVSDSEYSPA